MKNNFDILIAEIREKYLSINDELLRNFMLVFVCCSFAERFIRYTIENYEGLINEKFN